MTDASTPADIEAGLKALVVDRDGLKTTIVGLTTERDVANSNVERLEKLCGIHGVDPKAAIKPTGEPIVKVSMADYALKLRAAKTPEARAAVCAEYEKAVKEKRVAA